MAHSLWTPESELLLPPERGRSFDVRKLLTSHTDFSVESNQPILPADHKEYSAATHLFDIAIMASHAEPHESLSQQYFPTYVAIISTGQSSGVELVKGSICKRVMYKFEEGYPLRSIAASTNFFIRNRGRHGYSETPYEEQDIATIIKTCQRMSLKSTTPLAIFDNEAIEGWWIEEELDCRKEAHQQPISKEFCGLDGLPDWIWERSKAQNRDWERWASPSIGPQSRRPRCKKQ